jgi:hypothetical protein
VAIKPSSQKTVDALMRDLMSTRAVARDTAVARLAVIGARAVTRLAGLVDDPAIAAVSRAAALRALEAIADTRGLDAALRAFDDSDVTVASAAVSVARSMFGTPRGVEAVDRVTAVALDATRPSDLRRAAVRALADLAPSTVAPVFKALASDPDITLAALAAELGGGGAAATPAPRGPLDKWLDVETLEDPDGLRRALLAENGVGVPLAALHRLVQQLRDREAQEKPGRRAAWTTARAAVHAALAARGSRVALYDLRETLENASEPLPVEFLTALTRIGDVSCLEPVAAAYTRALRKQGDDWWRRHLLAAFHEIVRREKITARHAAMKRVQSRWPQVLGARN